MISYGTQLHGLDELGRLWSCGACERWSRRLGVVGLMSSMWWKKSWILWNNMLYHVIVYIINKYIFDIMDCRCYNILQLFMENYGHILMVHDGALYSIADFLVVKDTHTHSLSSNWWTWRISWGWFGGIFWVAVSGWWCLVDDGWWLMIRVMVGGYCLPIGGWCSELCLVDFDHFSL
jgi:hypothetical protein